MVDLRCPHDPIIGECPECAAIKRKADQAAALEARMEAIARKAVAEHMGDCPSYASLLAENERLRKAVEAAKSLMEDVAGVEATKDGVVRILFGGMELYYSLVKLRDALKKWEEG